MSTLNVVDDVDTHADLRSLTPQYVEVPSPPTNHGDSA